MGITITLGQDVQARICTACRLSRCRPGDRRCGLQKEQRRRNRANYLKLKASGHYERQKKDRAEKRGYWPELHGTD